MNETRRADLRRQSDQTQHGTTRTGAHRLPEKRWQKALPWAVSMLAGFAVLVGVGLFYLNQLDVGVEGFLASGPKYPDAEKPEYSVTEEPASYDDQFMVSVLNGTGQEDFASDVRIELQAADFNTSGSANASELTEQSAVFYSNINAEGSARAVAAALGIDEVQLATAYQGVPITVLLGSDYLTATN